MYPSVSINGNLVFSCKSRRRSPSGRRGLKLFSGFLGLALWASGMRCAWPTYSTWPIPNPGPGPVPHPDPSPRTWHTPRSHAPHVLQLIAQVFHALGRLAGGRQPGTLS